ncbi:alpha/beta hydrolase [Candidatus Micrarchaeota archaeon]|nr:alpha/beta hydrolase [Candidatus Micrarchaeota archaeon]
MLARVAERVENVPKPRSVSREPDLVKGVDKYVTAHDGAEVRYRFRLAKDGNANARTVALLGGFVTHPAVYLGQIPAFNELHNVLTMENRGHWKSSRGASTIGTYIEDLARDLKCALDAEGVGKAVLVAHSMWGAAAIRFRELFPERVEAIVFVCPAFTDPRELWAFGNPRWVKAVSQALFFSLQFNPFVDVVARLLEGRRLAWSAFSLLCVGVILEEAKNPEHELKVIKNVFRANMRSLAVAMRALFNVSGDWKARCAAINVPVLVIAGKRDSLILHGRVREFASNIPGASFFLDEEAIHFPMLSNPERFNRRILEFVGGLREKKQ